MKRIVLLATLTASICSIANASIAVFTDGRTSKIEKFEVVEEVVHLKLAAGGTMTIPLARVERIVDDEIVPAAEVAVVRKMIEEGVFPRRSWRFSEESKPLFNSRFNDTIVEAARHWDVDAALVSAVIKAESDYDPKTVSHKGARGLMQLMPATAKRFGVTDAHDPVMAIYAGTRYLRWLLDKFEGNADLAVAAYNAGEGNVWKYKGVPPFRETINYINRIARHIRKATEKKEAVATVASGAR